MGALGVPDQFCLLPQNFTLKITIKQAGGQALGEAMPTFMESSVQERVVEEQAATFRPALGLTPHHQLTAIGSLQTLGKNRGLRVKVTRVQGCWEVELGCSSGHLKA